MKSGQKKPDKYSWRRPWSQCSSPRCPPARPGAALRIWLLSVWLLALPAVAGAPRAGNDCLSLAAENGAMPVYIYRPQPDARDLPVVMVLHGVKRNARQARDQWIAAANRYHFMIIAPEFSNSAYPGARGYMLGNTRAGAPGQRGAPRPVAQWSYARIGQLFSRLQRAGVTRRTDYLLYGHSAGCQFVHRQLMALPDARVKAAVCASAGWWTPPDPRQDWPYGLAAAPFTLDHEQAARFFARPTLIMVGGQDTRTTHTAMRQTPQAEAQGATRLARAQWYFQRVRRLAKQLPKPLPQQPPTPFNWQFAVVDGAGHQSPLLIDRAAEFLNQFNR
ncbi:hypothetical protein ACL2XP_21215 [Sodalis sp. RH21]|uniref:hypothetical protein n=1 Tax=unclassified Sodalis (in: enterobacteria) TaxID=2636512 RepID=UPI0039B3A851